MPEDQITIPSSFTGPEHPLALAGQALLEKTAFPVSYSINEGQPQVNLIDSFFLKTSALTEER